MAVRKAVGRERCEVSNEEHSAILRFTFHASRFTVSERDRSGNGKDHFNFDGSPARQLSSPHSRAGMTTSLSKDLNQEVRGSVEDLGLLHKTFRRRHMPNDLHNARNAVQRPELLLGNRQCIQESKPGRFHPLLDRQITSKLTGKRQLSVLHGKDTGQKQETSDPDRRNVGRQGLRR